jgi:DNA-binding NarL/FixJ family response regulator
LISLRATRTNPPTTGATAQMSVVVVDDDALVRAGLGLILGGSPDLRVVGEAADGAAGVDLVARERPDVVLMDIRMPRLDGLSRRHAVSWRAGRRRASSCSRRSTPTTR